MRELLKEVVRFFSNLLIPVVLTSKTRDRVLATWQAPANRSILGKIVFPIVFDHWTRTVYLAEPNPEEREALKDICMTGASGVAWAAEYDGRPLDRSERYFELSFDEANPHFAAMENLLAHAEPEHLVVQVGCSSGRETAYFASRFPDVEFWGTDIEEHIVARARESYKLKNLKFKVMRAHEIQGFLPQSPSVTVFSSGSLQYVQPEHLQMMFGGLADRGRVNIILLEPWSAAGSTFYSNPYTRWRGNFSFSHDYQAFAKLVGFELLRQMNIQFTHDALSPHFQTRHYFYFGRTADRTF